MTDGSADPSAPAAVTEALKDRAMDEAPVGITISDHRAEDEPLIYANEAFERITGYPVDEIVGRNCRFLQGEDTDEAKVAEMRHAIDGGYPVQVTLRNYRKDGEPFWNEVTIAPIRDEDGTITNFVGFQNDVTVREELRRELERDRERLDTTVERIGTTITQITDAVRGSESPEEVERRLVANLAHERPWGAVWIATTADGEVTVTATDGGPPTGTALPLEHSPMAAVVEADDHSVIRSDAWRDAHPAHADWLDGADAVVVAPMLSAAGADRLVVAALPSSDVDHREITVLDAVCDTAGIAIAALTVE